MSYVRATDPVLDGWYILTMAGDVDAQQRAQLVFYHHPGGDTPIRLTVEQAAKLRDVLNDFIAEEPKMTQWEADQRVIKARKPQGRCATTQTERFENPDCRCDTYEGNLGPCRFFYAGGNGRCVYCDHELDCHGVDHRV